MNSGSIKFVTFDIFNTLIKTRGKVGEIYSATSHSLFPTYFKDNCSSLAENIDLHFVEVYKGYLEKYPNFGYDKISSKDFWHQIVCGVFQKSGYHFKIRDMQKLTDTLYFDFCTERNWDVFDDVIPLLDCLKNNNIKMGIISNFDERLNSILHNINLSNYFEFVVCSREVGISKPNSDIYRLALSLAKVSPKHCLHVGDNIDLDFHAARQLGINAYVINRSNPSDDYQLNSLIEIIKILGLK